MTGNPEEQARWNAEETERELRELRQALPLLEIPTYGLVWIGVHQLRLPYHALYRFANGWQASLIPLGPSYYPYRPQWELCLRNRGGTPIEGGEDEPEELRHDRWLRWRGGWHEINETLHAINALPEAPHGRLPTTRPHEGNEEGE